METDDVMLQFDVLERKVNDLIERCKAAEDAGSALKARIEELESELQEKENMLNRYSQQKTQVRSKIDDLLERLDSLS